MQQIPIKKGERALLAALMFPEIDTSEMTDQQLDELGVPAFDVKYTQVVNINKDKYDVYCGRPSLFGNPFIIGKDGDRDEVCDKFEEYFFERLKTDIPFFNEVMQLKNKRLGCHCSPLRCHLDTIKNWLESI